MYVSVIGNDEEIIGDDNWKSFVLPPSADGESQSGYIPRDRNSHPEGSYVGSASPSLVTRLKQKWPRETWKARIEELGRKRMSISERLRAAPKQWLNQNPTNGCWCFAVVQAVMIIRFLMNLPWVRLSPFSVCGPLKNYRNSGGWGSQALSYIVQHGIADVAHWPMSTPENAGTSAGNQANMNAYTNGRQYFASSRENAARHKVDEFADLPDRDFPALMGFLMEPLPVPVGLSWQGHEWTAIDALILPNGGFGVRSMDQYGRDGNYSSAVYTESLATPDDAVCPLVSAPVFV